jgi:hypothetical protein
MKEEPTGPAGTDRKKKGRKLKGEEEQTTKTFTRIVKNMR